METCSQIKQDTRNVILERARQADIITFDVFDTLITRAVLHPTDLFSVVGMAAESFLPSSMNFKACRILSEEDAYREKGCTATLEDIYICMGKRYAIPEHALNTIREYEFQTELALSHPRADMPELLEELRTLGKEIILISDMYLSSCQIRQLLTACGYPDTLPLVVSCEAGVDKNSGRLWKRFFRSHKGKRTLHIGDNPTGDFYMVKAFGREAILVPNGLNSVRRSAIYSQLERFDDGSPANALVLGQLVNVTLFSSPFRSGTMPGDRAASWAESVLASHSSRGCQYEAPEELVRAMESLPEVERLPPEDINKKISVRSWAKTMIKCSFPSWLNTSVRRLQNKLRKSTQYQKIRK